MSREYPTRPIVGVGVIVLSDAGVLLIQRGNPPSAGSWSLPGGGQEVGETIVAAGRREVMEETGVDAEILGVVDVVDNIRPDGEGRVQFHYTLVDLLGVSDATAPLAGCDAADARWVPTDALEPFALWSETARVIRLAEEMWDSLGRPRPGDLPEPPAAQRSRNDIEIEL